MSINTFIPEAWASEMIVQFRQKAIIAALTNRQYEGDLVHGNKLHINGLVEIAIKDYKAAGRTTSPDNISSTTIELDIDNEKSFDFQIDDIDRAQAAGALGQYTESAAWAMANEADQYLAAQLVTAGNVITSGVTDAASAWNAFTDGAKALNKAKAPQDNRVALINAEFAHLLVQNDAKLVAANTAGTTDTLRNANLGRILGFDVYSTENLPTTSKPQIVFMNTSSFAFVSQVQKVEAMRSQSSFADRLRGLHVYGSKVVRQNGIYSITAA